MSYPRTSPLLLSLLITCWGLTAPTALAHGPGGAALGVLALDDAGAPAAIRLTTGIAVHTDGTWRFLCPSLWGAIEIPPAASTGRFPVWILGQEQTWLLHADGELTPANTDITARNIITLVSHPEAVFVLRNDGTLWRLEPDGTARNLADVSGYSHLTATRDAVVLVRKLADTQAIELASFSLEGAPLTTLTLPNPDDATPLVRSAGGELFLSRVASLSFVLERVEMDGSLRETIASSDKPILGPAMDGDVPLFASLSQLQSFSDGASTVLETARLAACVGELDTLDYACVLPHLYRISQAGMETEPVFSIETIFPPDLTGMEDALAEECRIEWLHFTSEAGLDPDGPGGEDIASEGVEQVEDPRVNTTSCGCNHLVHSRRTIAPMLLLLLALMALRR